MSLCHSEQTTQVAFFCSYFGLLVKPHRKSETLVTRNLLLLPHLVFPRGTKLLYFMLSSLQYSLSPLSKPKYDPFYIQIHSLWTCSKYEKTWLCYNANAKNIHPRSVPFPLFKCCTKKHLLGIPGKPQEQSERNHHQQS